jgi:hypothetical protein
VQVLPLVRYWLPAVVIVAGVLVMALGHGDNALIGGAGIVGAGLSIYLLNLLYRMGSSGDTERDREEAARAFFDAHGYWPDEQPPPGRARQPSAPHKTRPPHEQHVSPLPRQREKE